MGFREFVALMAAFMAINALAIDSMLPALPQIGHALGIDDENKRQWIVTAYLLGFGVAQIFYGTVSDRFGRKPVMLTGLGLYLLFSIAAAFAGSFEIMMIARILQGIGAAAARVVVVSIVRDCYSGRQMARVMSLSFIVFLAVPILAPSIGQLIMLLGPWRWIFGALALFALAILIWAALRLPETLHPEYRSPLSVARVMEAFKIVVTTRLAIGYTIAMTLLFGALFGFINSSQQVFVDVFKAPGMFTTIFAMIAIFMAVAAFVNSRIVERLGMRRVSHTALLGFVGFALLNLFVTISGHETLWTFAILQSATMFCFGLTASNFGAMAMEPVGHVAGTASSVQGLISTVGGALIGFFVGQHFDGTTIPLMLGFAGLGVLAILAVLVTEGGRLFKPHNAPPAKPTI